ncbi:sugar phosphate isomerase/epimerase family protein [Bosea sp. NPDC003192]|jgi:L-ribulose-5-phosphate 3-epimerase|uniref:sugar phosphate isomerase/epimerase family protein n=1 Tax=Bosea sp. NPDC003192 TaxID=3390551 RepID=UPI003D07D7BD
MGIRLGGTTFSFMWSEPALATMRRIGELGLKEFDVIMAPGHLWPDELDGAARRELRQGLAQDGLRVETTNLPALDFNLGSCLPEVRGYAIGRYADALRLSADLGGRGVVTVPGRVSGLLAPDRDDTLSWLGDSIAALLRVADETGQDLLLETHPQTAIASAEAMVAFVEAFSHPRLLVAYDVANAEFIGENQAEAIRLLRPMLAQVHLSDATRTSWKHDRAGLGTVRFDRVRAALEEVDFGGVAIIEVISANTLPDTKATIEAWGP